MATLTPTGATGTGTETLTFNLGSNTSGSAKTYSFKLRESGSSAIADTLTVTQPSSGVDVTGVTLTPSQVTINMGNSYNDVFSVIITPSNASDKTISWSSDDSSEVMVNGSGEIRGVAVTSMPIGVWAEAHNGISDVSYVTVVEPGSITVGSVNALKNQDSIAVPVTLYNIDTDRPITITVTSGTSWVTNIGSYDSSQHAVTIGISRNLTTNDRSTTVTVSGYDLAGEGRTGSGTLSQNGVDDIDLISLSVNGDAAINDDGTTYHRYVVTYNPSTTSETGVTWDVVDSQGNSVDGTLVDIGSTTSTYCDITVLSGADGDNVFVKATSTVRPSISATQAVTVTYAPVIAELQASPTSLSVPWDSTADSTPVVTWSNVQTPYIPTNGGWSGFITGASLNTTNGKIITEYSANSSTSSQSGSVTVYALKDGEVTPISVTVNYTQAGMPNPSTFATIGVANLVVTSGGRSSITADVILSNTSYTSHTFSGEYYWTLYGYSSKENYDLGETGTVLIGDQVETGYTPTVAARSSVTISLSHEAHLSFTGNYFKIHVSMQQHGEADAFAYLSEPSIEPVE